MDADKQAQAKMLMEQLANLLASAESEDGSFKTFDQIELHAISYGDQFTNLLTQRGIDQSVDCKNQSPRCPTCDQPGCRHDEPDPRVIQAARGEVQWNEDEYFCRKCRKSFFPSTLCANMSETTLSFFKVEGTESLYDRNDQRKS